MKYEEHFLPQLLFMDEVKEKKKKEKKENSLKLPFTSLNNSYYFSFYSYSLCEVIDKP